ncbi:hypothetical protein TNCV_4955341 [Trichonephila clavipes]|nr:hypothetical protein TNCV_4955341 [Trichonephila clavipes]
MWEIEGLDEIWENQNFIISVNSDSSDSDSEIMSADDLSRNYHQSPSVSVPRLHGTRQFRNADESRDYTGIFFQPVYMRFGCVFIRICQSSSCHTAECTTPLSSCPSSKTCPEMGLRTAYIR